MPPRVAGSFFFEVVLVVVVVRFVVENFIMLVMGG